MTNFTFTFTVEAPPPPTGGTLTSVANALGVNQWALFKGPQDWPGGVAAFWKMPGANDNILDFLHTGVHDTVRGNVHILGAGYGFVTGQAILDIASNTWTSHSINTNIIHGWDHVALDEATGRIYYGNQWGNGMFYTTATTPTVAASIPAPWSNTLDT